MISVLIAEDQDMVRAGFRLILEAQPDVRVVADVADGLSAVQRAKELKPQVCLVDVRMPGLDGLTLAQQIKGDSAVRETLLLLLTSVDRLPSAEEQAKVGLAGAMAKPLRQSRLFDAIVDALHASDDGPRQPEQGHAVVQQPPAARRGGLGWRAARPHLHGL